jgi:hypothetical protein
MNSTITGYKNASHVWWFTLVIPAPGRLKQEDPHFKAILDYIVRLCLKTNKKNYSIHAVT